MEFQFQLVTSFLIPILLFIGFMFMFRAITGLHQQILRQVQTSSEETNSMLREILAELKASK